MQFNVSIRIVCVICLFFVLNTFLPLAVAQDEGLRHMRNNKLKHDAEFARKLRDAYLRKIKNAKLFKSRCQRENKQIKSETNSMFGNYRTWYVDSHPISGGLSLFDKPHACITTNGGPIGGIKYKQLSQKDQYHLDLFESWRKAGNGKARAIWMDANGGWLRHEEQLGHCLFGIKDIGSMEILSDYPFTTYSESSKNDGLAALQFASGTYLDGKQRVEWKTDLERLIRISESGDKRLASLARLLILRELTRNSISESKLQFGPHFDRAMMAVGEIVANRTIKGLTNQEHHWSEDVIPIVQGLIAIEADGVEAEKRKLEQLREYWLVNQSLSFEVARLMNASKNRQQSVFNPADIKAKLFVMVDDQPDSKHHFLTSFEVSRTKEQKDQRAIPWCVIQVSRECDSIPGKVKTENEEWAELVLDIVTGGNAPDYSGRDRALRKYLATDRYHLFFVEDWKPGQKFKLVTDSAFEFLQNSKSAEISIMAPGFNHVVKLDMNKAPRKIAKVMGKRLR